MMRPHNFSLGMDTVQKLSLATPSQLEALASGVLISFKLKTTEQNIILLTLWRLRPCSFYQP